MADDEANTTPVLEADFEEVVDKIKMMGDDG